MIYIFIYIYTYIYIYTLYIYIYIYIYVYKYTYTYTYIHLYTYMHIHIYTSFSKDVFCNFLEFTRCNCLQMFPVFLNKNFFAFQSSKKSYLKLQLSSVISFVLPSEFRQFDEKLYYVVHRELLYDFRGYYVVSLLH